MIGRWRAWFVFGVSLALILVFGSFTAAEIPQDAKYHWARADIERAREEGWVTGYPDGTFRPDASVTRAEFVKMLGVVYANWVRILAPTVFSDSNDHWVALTGYLQEAIEAGIIRPSEYPDGRFEPDRSITRSEVALMLARTNVWHNDTFLWSIATEDSELPAFPDVAGLPSEVRQAISGLSGAGVIRGFPDNTFRGDATTTRAEAVVLIRRFREALLETGLGMPPLAPGASHLAILPIKAVGIGEPQRVIVEARNRRGRCGACWRPGDFGEGTIWVLTARDASGQDLETKVVLQPESSANPPESGSAVWGGRAVFEVMPTVAGTVYYEATGTMYGFPLEPASAVGRVLSAE